MQIGFGATIWRFGERNQCLDGIGQYCKSLEQALRARGVNTHLFDFSPPELARLGDTAVGRFRPQGVKALIGLAAFEQLQEMAYQQKLSLIHSTDHLVPRLRHTPVVATVMDALPLSHPHWVDYRFKWLKNTAWRKSVSWADHVITISNFSKGELVRWFGLKPEKITVTTLGVDAAWFKPPTAEKLSSVLSRHGLIPGYVLVVGTIQPRKNIQGALQAFERLPVKLRAQHPLVVVGRAGWGAVGAVEALQKAGPFVHWLRRISDDDVHALMHAAGALLMLSHYEGFGLPVLEAFASGVPVVAANGTALTEIAGDAAILVQPNKANQATEALQAVLTMPEVTKPLVEAGLERARAANWDNTATATMAAYRCVQ